MRYDISGIGQDIKNIYSKKMSQEAFAESIGVCSCAVSRWVTDMAIPSLMNILAICDEYNMKITDFIKPMGEDKPEQISMLYRKGEDVSEIREQADRFLEYSKKKRNWENAFQKWSDEQGMDGAEAYGACGYGSMCDYCEDNSYGRPCVRALNAMCRDKGIQVNYNDREFEKVWKGDELL